MFFSCAFFLCISDTIDSNIVKSIHFIMTWDVAGHDILAFGLNIWEASTSRTYMIGILDLQMCFRHYRKFIFYFFLFYRSPVFLY